MYEEITKEAETAVKELLGTARLKPEDIFVVGCSSSEVSGHNIGSYSNTEIADALLAGIYPELKKRGYILPPSAASTLTGR